MKKTKAICILSFSLCFVLITAMALMLCGCGKENKNGENAETEKVSNGIVGEGETQFYLTIKANGTEKRLTVKTNETTVGNALIALGLIDGDRGDYGLYVKEVDGIYADFEEDGTYWAFYVDGEYATKGAEKTEIVPDTEYTFSKEK